MAKGDKLKIVLELKDKNVTVDDCIKQLKGKVSTIYIKRVYSK